MWKSQNLKSRRTICENKNCEKFQRQKQWQPILFQNNIIFLLKSNFRLARLILKLYDNNNNTNKTCTMNYRQYFLTLKFLVVPYIRNQ